VKFQAILPLLPKALQLQAGEDLDTHINTSQRYLKFSDQPA
jgi:hypothetical protein